MPTTPTPATPTNQPTTPGFQAPSSSSGAADVDKTLADAARDAADALRLADGLKKINMATMAFLAEVEKANKWFEKAASA